jgi:hypothetical protein
MSTVTIDAAGNAVEPRVNGHHRVLLTAQALARVSELAGFESPLAQMVSGQVAPDTLGIRLGGLAEGAHTSSSPHSAPQASASLVEHELFAQGLLGVEQKPTPGMVAALEVWHRPDVAVEIDLVVPGREGRARVRSWHRSRAGWVVTVSTADGKHAELSCFPADNWWYELVRSAFVPMAGHPPRSAAEMPDVIDTPWELLLATGEAVQAGRSDLVPELVAQHAGLTRGGLSEHALETACVGDVERWHRGLASQACGRLHASVVARGRGARVGAGVLEWVLFPDGWRAVTPFVRDGWRMVRVERVTPFELGRSVASLAGALTS